MMSNYKAVLFATFLFVPFLLTAQDVTFPINIHNGQNIETCTGIFTDSGGDTLSPYSNNENYSVTFTAPQDGTEPLYLSLDFLFLELGEDDAITIYDGQDANAPLLSSLTSDNQLTDNKIWSTGTSLHIEFISSEADSALGWAARIACFELCEAFYAEINTSTGSFDFCPDVSSVSFTANTAFYGGEPEGTLENVTYQWNFDNQILEGPVVNQNYDGPGAYPFRITVSDPDNNCTLDSIITVRFATIPNFNNTISTSDTVCAGEPFSLVGNVQTIPWTGFPTRVDTLSFITYEEDFSSTLTFDVFPEDVTILQEDDFDRVCINIEHEDNGHLAFELECPSGNTVLLKDFSPGGANLGEPVIFGSQEIPGLGYEYCFSTSPQFGRMSQTSFQFHSFTDQAGDFYNNQPYMPEGTYMPDESFSNLIGCPLNGEWTIKATDQIIGTSGHIVGWSMFFKEDFYPDSLIFTPEIIDEKWFDENGNEMGGNPANANLNTQGEYNFTFRALDDFGCSWDTTLTVTVLPLPKGEITSDMEIPVCEGDSTLLMVVPEIIGEEIDWLYQWMVEGAELENRISDTLMAKEMANYMVRVTDTITGCFDFFELAVSDQNCDLEIPNVFTPNGDGMNELFEITNLEYYPQSSIVIYNRSGKKVFESNDYYLNWWDGGNQPDGTYYYVITYTRMDERKQAHGIITIIR